MEPTVSSAPICSKLASVEHISRMLHQPCHYRMVIGKSSLDSPLQRHFECADFIHDLPYGPFRKAIGLRFTGVAMFRHRNVSSLHRWIRRFIGNGSNAHSIAPGHGASILDK